MEDKKLAILKPPIDKYSVEIVPPSISLLVKPNGSLIPEHWMMFKVGEIVTIKNYTFKVAYTNESTLLLEPTGPVLVGKD
jgi:hypothetical protein